MPKEANYINVRITGKLAFTIVKQVGILAKLLPDMLYFFLYLCKILFQISGFAGKLTIQASIAIFAFLDNLLLRGY